MYYAHMPRRGQQANFILPGLERERTLGSNRRGVVDLQRSRWSRLSGKRLLLVWLWPFFQFPFIKESGTNVAWSKRADSPGS